MITNINKFNKDLTSGRIRKINEQFITEEELTEFDDNEFDMIPDGDMEDTPLDDMPIDDEIEMEDDTPKITLDSLKDTLLMKFNDVETEDETEAPIMLSDEQLDIVFNALIELGVAEVEEEEMGDAEGDDEFPEAEEGEEVEDEEFEEDEEDFEMLEESLKRKKALANRIAKLENKNILLVNGKTKKYTVIKESVKALEKIAEGNYNGKFLPKAIKINGKTAIIYKPMK